MDYRRLLGARKNRLAQSCGSLLGICAGVIADDKLNDAEIGFLGAWLKANEDVSLAWPGDVLYDRVKAVLADGVISEEERAHLVETLEKICGGSDVEDVVNSTAVNQLAFDEPPAIAFPGSAFCVTGEFMFGPRDRVCETIAQRGGLILKGVTKKLNYLVVGMRGSEEWKHGSYGTKIEKAIEYKRGGVRLFIVREDTWTGAVRAV